MDDILRYGAKELFTEKDEDGKARQIHYDDVAIDRFVLFKHCSRYSSQDHEMVHFKLNSFQCLS